VRLGNASSLSIVFYLVAAFWSSAFARQLQPVEESLSRVKAQIQSGDLRSARAELERAALRFPGDPRVYNFLGVVEAQAKNFASAESNFRKAIHAAPQFPDPYLNLGRLYQENSAERPARERALATYQGLLALKADHAEANFQAASLLTELGSYKASLKHLARLPAEFQQLPATIALRCADNAAIGQTIQAQAEGKQLLASVNLTEADVLGILPSLLEHHVDGLAEQLLEGLVNRGLASGSALWKLAELHQTRGRFQEARLTLQKNLELEQPTVRVLSQLGRLAYLSGDLEGALAYLGHARDLEPRNASIHFFIGVVCIELKLPPEARKSLEQALKLDPENPHYNYALGAILVNEKKPEEAIPRFRQYRGSLPADPRGGFALGVAYFDAYQLDLARQEFQSIVNRPETKMGAQLYLGRLALQEERLDEAMDHFQQAIQANPAVPEAFAESALVHIRRSEYSQAEKDLGSALRMAPEHYLANLRLLMLYQRTKDSRAEAQAIKVAQLQKAGEERERLLLRTVEIRPIGRPIR
jgi:tetratricopeptide (TPR) repeat protein